ncbi:MAG: hypothetical protein ACK5Z5_05105 [Neisseriaceae bacterium]
MSIQDDDIIIPAYYINDKYPSKNILYRKLTEVVSKNGNKYYIYWDKKFLVDNKHTQAINALKKVFLEGKEVKSKLSSAGIKLLYPPVSLNKNGLVFSHELKTLSKDFSRTRIYGLIHPTEIGFIVIFCYFDRKGKLTGH